MKMGKGTPAGQAEGRQTAIAVGVVTSYGDTFSVILGSPYGGTLTLMADLFVSLERR
jgi:hypothetical protein